MKIIKMHIVLASARQCELEDWYDDCTVFWLPELRKFSATYRYYFFKQVSSLAKQERVSPYYTPVTVNRLMDFAEQIKKLG